MNVLSYLPYSAFRTSLNPNPSQLEDTKSWNKFIKDNKAAPKRGSERGSERGAEKGSGKIDQEMRKKRKRADR